MKLAKNEITETSNIKEKKNRNPFSCEHMLWPVLLVAFVPCILIGTQYKTGLGQFPWFFEEVRVDIFLYYKMWALTIIAALMLIKIAVYKISGQKLMKQTKKDILQWIFIAGFMIMMTLSTCLSEYAYWGFHGSFDEFETVQAVLAYGVLAFYAFLFVRNERDFQSVLNAIGIGVAIVAGIGTLQALEMDILRYNPICAFLSWTQGCQITFNMPLGTSYTTLFNPNYVGSYCVLMLPVTIAAFLKTKRGNWKSLHATNIVLLIITLFGCKSLSAMAVLVFLALVVVLVKIKPIFAFCKKYRRISLPVSIVVLIGAIIVLSAKGGYYVNKIVSNLTMEKEDSTIERDLVTCDDYVAIRFDEQWLYVHMNMQCDTVDEFIYITDQYSNLIPVNYLSNEALELDPSTGIDLTMTFGNVYEGRPGFVATIDGEYVLGFVMMEDGFYQFSGANKMAKLDTTKVERAEILKGYEAFASGRGYIWERTLPILRRTLVLGTGRNSFIQVYPNDDWFYRIHTGGSNIVTTRPHCLYLNLMVQDGIVGTIFCILGVLILFVRFLRKRKQMDVLAVGMFIAMVGFAIMGLTNDPKVVITPIFWLWFGLCSKKVHLEEIENQE